MVEEVVHPCNPNPCPSNHLCQVNRKGCFDEINCQPFVCVPGATSAAPAPPAAAPFPFAALAPSPSLSSPSPASAFVPSPAPAPAHSPSSSPVTAPAPSLATAPAPACVQSPASPFSLSFFCSCSTLTSCVLQAARCARPPSTWCSRKLVSRCPPTPVPPAAMKCAPAAPVAAWRTAWRCHVWTPASTEAQGRGRVSKTPTDAHRLGGKSITVSV